MIQSVLISQVECVYRKELFLRYHCIITLGHKLVTLGLLIANRQLAYSVCSPSYHRENLFCSTLMGRCLIACCYKLDRLPVTEKRHSTGTDPADMQTVCAASCCNIFNMHAA